MWGSRRISADGGEHRARRLVRSGALLAALAMAGMSTPAEAAAPSVLQQEWWLGGSMDYQGAWQTGGSLEGSNVTVAVIGDVANTGALDLQGNFASPKAFPPTLTQIDIGKNDTGNECLATEVASIIAGHQHAGAHNSKVGMAGIAPEASILPIAVSLDSSLFADSTYTSEAIRAAVGAGAKVIQIIYKTHDDQAIQSAVAYALAHNVAVVAQTGNDGKSGNKAIAPSDIPGVIGVAGVEHSTLQRWPSSISGTQVTVAAPATDIIAEQADNAYGVKNSTSCAAAMVSGELAELWAVHPDWTVGQIIRVLLKSAQGQGTRLNDDVGYGLINPTAAMQEAAPAQTSNPLLPAKATAAPSPTASSHPSAAAAAGSSGSSGSSGGMLLLIIGIVVGVLVLAGGGLLLKKRLGPRKRYVLPPPAPSFNAGPSDYGLYQQPGYGPGGGFQPQPQPQPQPPQQPGYPPRYESQPPAQPQPQYQAPYEPPQQQFPQQYGYPQQPADALDESGYTLNPYFPQAPEEPAEGRQPPAEDGSQGPQQGYPQQ